MLPGKHSLGGTGHTLHQWAQVGLSPHGSSPSHYQQCFSPWSTSLVAQAPLSCQILPSQAWQLSRHPCCLECSIVLLLKLGSIKPPCPPRTARTGDLSWLQSFGLAAVGGLDPHFFFTLSSVFTRDEYNLLYDCWKTSTNIYKKDNAETSSLVISNSSIGTKW